LATYIWVHEKTIVRRASYSLTESLLEHIEVIQPTTMFAPFKRMPTIIYRPLAAVDAELQPSEGTETYRLLSGAIVDVQCNTQMTIRCPQQLYITIGYKPEAKHTPLSISVAIPSLHNFSCVSLVLTLYEINFKPEPPTASGLCSL